MRIAFDAWNLALPEGTGIATYTRVLESALIGMGAEVHAVYGARRARGDLPDEIGFFDAFRPSPPRGRLARAAATVARIATHAGRPFRAVPVPIGIVERRPLATRLPRAAAVHNAHRLYEVAHQLFRLTGALQSLEMSPEVDVFHATCPIPVTMRRAANVVTVHDLVPFTHPYTTLDRKHDHWRLVREAADRADLIFAISERTRADLVRIAGVPEEKIRVTYQAVELPPPPPGMPSPLGLQPGGFLLFVGAIEPKKNVHRLLEAYLACGVRLPLVLAGPEGWMVDDELRLLPAAGRRVIRLTFPTCATMATLYRDARALVVPSLDEGFGLPALEAMTLGCPVVAARAGALPEVCGDAARYVDPYDVADLAAGLRDVCEDDALCARLRAAGRRQAERFSMTAYRERLTTGYADAIRARRDRIGAKP